MMAIITADELAHDLPGAEAMMTRYKEHRAEIDSRKDAFKKFHQTVESFISQGHFLSEEVSFHLLLLHLCCFFVFIYFFCFIMISCVYIFTCVDQRKDQTARPVSGRFN